MEAAIGLRSSTESPERSSSPESDSLMMADRNVMTLPLRKRKHYMNEGEVNNGGGSCSNSAAAAAAAAASGVGGGAVNESAGTAASAADGATSSTAGSKVMRMSSVIQFAKAS